MTTDTIWGLVQPCAVCARLASKRDLRYQRAVARSLSSQFSPSTSTERDWVALPTVAPHKALAPHSALKASRLLAPHSALLPQSALLPHNAFCVPTNRLAPHRALAPQRALLPPRVELLWTK